MITNEEYMEIEVLRRRGGSLREIATEAGLAVNTVRKYLREGAPRRKAALSRRPSKLDEFDGYLRERIEAAKPHWIPATVLLREIQERGYEGSLRILQVRLKGMRPAARPDPVVRFETAAGEQMQMDWIEFRKSGHRAGMLAAFVATLGYSRASYVEFVTDMKLETLLACHRRAFEAFGGVTREIVYDNMKTVIVKRDAYGKAMHQYQAGFADFARHYGFMPRLCRPYRAKTKGKVERMNGYLRHSFWVPLEASCKQRGIVADVGVANIEVRRWLREVANARRHATTGEVPAERLERERAQLQALPPPYSGLSVRQLQVGETQSPRERDTSPRAIPAVAWQPMQHPLSVYQALLAPLGQPVAELRP
ncbi:MAG: IS21 family transposase [Burkholderiales bacterium]|nr:IS21 family transposase [Burkholderiales bacterium]